MARDVSRQEMATEFDRKGIFKALADFVRDGSMTKQTAEQLRSDAFKIFLKQVQEGKSEVTHLNGSIARLEQICRAGANVRPGSVHAPWVDRPPEVGRLAEEIMTFDGWVVSLYETAITMMYFGAPDRARAKPTEMVQSLEALRQKRLQQLDLDLKDPTLFKYA